MAFQDHCLIPDLMYLIEYFRNIWVGTILFLNMKRAMPLEYTMEICSCLYLWNLKFSVLYAYILNITYIMFVCSLYEDANVKYLFIVLIWQVTRVRELFHGQFNKQEIMRLLETHGWNQKEAVNFVLKSELFSI